MAYSKDNPNPLPRAVVVNDDPTQLSMLCGLLRKAGFEPHPYQRVESALVAMSQDLPPALLVTDLYMPDIDGWRFCRLLRSPEYAQFNQVPILVVSATFSGDEPSEITSDLGANAFMPMPVNGQRFIEVTQALLKGEKSQDVLRVLVVEDSKLVSQRLLTAFQAHGYLVDAAFTVQEAFARIGQTTYDIVVLDYHLPDGQGDVLLKELQGKFPDCICMMITADPQPDLALKWMKMGAVAYLRKPFDPPYLIAQCERARRERALLRIQDLLEISTHQLKESEDRFRNIFENVPIGMFQSTPEGKFVYTNPALSIMLGYDLPDELIQTVNRTSIADVLYEDPTRRPLLVREVQLSSGSWQVFENRYRCKDGHIIDALLSFCERPDPMTGQRFLYGFVQDITERKRAEEARRESEQRYHLIDEASQDLIYSYDRQGRFTHANSKLCKLLGLKSEQIIGKTHEELGFPQAQCQEWARLHQQVYATHSTVISETLTPIQGAAPQYFEVVLNPIYDQTGEMIGIAGTTRDINARKAAEAKISEQLEELRRWHQITLGREERILELKREVNKLLAEAGKPPRFARIEEV